jgi:hypothetical protein
MHSLLEDEKFYTLILFRLPSKMRFREEITNELLECDCSYKSFDSSLMFLCQFTSLKAERFKTVWPSHFNSCTFASVQDRNCHLEARL